MTNSSTLTRTRTKDADATKKETKKRKTIQWTLLLLVIMTIAMGWKYPVLGYSVPLVMLAGITGSFVKGRYVCGNLCPRGSFLDRIIAPLSRQKDIPQFLRGMTFRLIMMAALMGFMFYRGFQNPTSFDHWGIVFWSMCVITTGVAVMLGLFIHQRGWCSFCPMGTMQNLIGGGKSLLQINASSCKGCKLCERSCTMGLRIVASKAQGYLASRDCLKCSECIDACPKNALSWS